MIVEFIDKHFSPKKKNIFSCNLSSHLFHLDLVLILILILILDLVVSSCLPSSLVFSFVFSRPVFFSSSLFSLSPSSFSVCLCLSPCDVVLCVGVHVVSVVWSVVCVIVAVAVVVVMVWVWTVWRVWYK